MCLACVGDLHSSDFNDNYNIMHTNNVWWVCECDDVDVDNDEKEMKTMMRMK